MPNPGPNIQGIPNSMQESIAAGNNVVYTFAQLPAASNYAPGFLAITSDQGLCVVQIVNGVYTWVPVGHGSLTVEAGTNSVSSGTVSFANSNGVTFGMNTAGVITATVTPGAAAGIGAIELPNTTYTSGTVNFLNSNGISFGSTTGGGVTASYNSTQFAGTGTTFAGTNVSGTLGLNSNGLALSLSGPVESGVGISAAGSSISAGNVVFSNANGVSFGMNGSTVTASAAAGAGGINASLGGNTSGALALISTGTLFLAGGNNVTLSQNGNSVTISANTAAAANLSVSAGSTTGAFGGLTFSNSNNLSFGLNNGTITGSVNAPGLGTTFNGANVSASMTLNSAGLALSLSSPIESGIGLSAAGSSQTAGNLVLSNSNGLSFGMNGSTITGSYNSTQFAGLGTTFSGTNVSGSMTLNSAGLNLALSGAAGSSQTEALYLAGNTTGQSSQSTYTVGSFNISAAGIISAGWSSNSLILSAPGTTAFNLSAYAVSNTTQSSSGTVAGTALSFAGAGGASVGISNGSVVISAGAAGGASTVGAYALGNTTQNSSTTLNQSALSFNALGAMTWGYSNGSIQVSAPATSSISGTGLVSVSVNGSTISIGANALTAYAVSNTTQSSSGTVNGTALSFAGAGGVSVGVSNGSVLISGGAGGGGSVNFSAGTTSSNLGSVVFSNSNGVSFGLNASTITASANGISTIGLYGLGNTTQNSSTTLNQSALSFNGLGELTVGYSNGSIQLSAPPSSIGVSTGGNTAGNTGTYSGQAIFAGGNNITLSVGSAAGGAQTISIAGANQISTVGLYALGNTTQNSSTTLNQSALSFDALGAMTMGYSNGSIQVSAPATSSISGTGQVSVSVNGSTISIGVPAQVTNTDFFAPYEDLQLAPTQVGQGSLIFDPQPFPNVQFDRVFFPIYNTNGLASSGSHSLSFYAGIYSRNASTLSLIGSTSLSTALTQSGTLGSYSLYSGMRGFSMGSTTTLSSGNYWIAFASRSSSAGADGSYSNMALNGGFFTDALLSGTLSYGGYFGSAVNATNQLALGQGFYSATTTGMPASVAFSQINGTASNAGNMQGMIFASSTV